MLLALALLLAGCGPTLREAISQRTISNTRFTGVAAFPFGEGPEAPKLLVGEIQHTFSPTSEGEIRSPALINRTAVDGLSVTSTTALGDVGDEFREGGEHVGRALEALHGRAPAADR